MRNIACLAAATSFAYWTSACRKAHWESGFSEIYSAATGSMAEEVPTSRVK